MTLSCEIERVVLVSGVKLTPKLYSVAITLPDDALSASKRLVRDFKPRKNFHVHTSFHTSEDKTVFIIKPRSQMSSRHKHSTNRPSSASRSVEGALNCRFPHSRAVRASSAHARALLKTHANSDLLSEFFFQKIDCVTRANCKAI